MQLKKHQIEIPCANPKTLKSDINDLKADYFPQWWNAFAMYDRLIQGALVIKFPQDYKVNLGFNGEDFSAPLTFDEIIIKVLQVGNKQSRFAISHLSEQEVDQFKKLSDKFYLEITSTHIVFTPKLGKAQATEVLTQKKEEGIGTKQVDKQDNKEDKEDAYGF